MSHSNYTPLPPGYFWDWEPTGERKPVASADPRMEIPVPIDQGWIPNARITPTPPEVWAASAPQNPLFQQLIAHILRTGGRI